MLRRDANHIDWLDGNDSDLPLASLSVDGERVVDEFGESFVVAAMELSLGVIPEQGIQSNLRLEVASTLKDRELPLTLFPLAVDVKPPGSNSLDRQAVFTTEDRARTTFSNGDSSIGLEFWLVQNLDMVVADEGGGQFTTSEEVTSFYLVGRLVEFTPLSGRVEGAFVNPSRISQQVKGQGTNEITWPVDAVPNKLSFVGEEFVVVPEQPFHLGSIQFANGVHSTDTRISGVEFATTVQIESKDDFVTNWPLNIVGSLNSEQRVLSADLIEFDQQIAPGFLQYGGFRYQLLVWFANPSKNGFTQFGGFGVFEETESRAELWGVFTQVWERKAEEERERLEQATRQNAVLTEPRWVASSDLFSQSKSPIGLDIGDYNDDDVDDVLVVADDHFELFTRADDSTWQSKVTPLSGDAKALSHHADFNGDDLVDVALFGELIEFWINDGTGGFGKSDQVLPGQTYDYQVFGGVEVLAAIYGDMAVGDYDGDLDLDIAVFSGREETNALYLNAGDGSFSLGQQLELPSALDISARLGVSAADFDRDGDLDLILGAFSTVIESGIFLTNDGNGQFSEGQRVRLDTGPSLKVVNGAGLVVGDFDSDDDVDGLYLYRDAGNILLHNDGSGEFSQSFGRLASYSLRGWVDDLDHDGTNDLLLNHANVPIEVGERPTLYSTIFLGRHGRGLVGSQTFQTGDVRAYSVGDVSGDGRTDLLVGTSRGVELWERGADRLYSAEDYTPVEVTDEVVRRELVSQFGSRLLLVDLERLTTLILDLGERSTVVLPAALKNLRFLQIRGGQIGRLDLPDGMEELEQVTIIRDQPALETETGTLGFTLGKGFKSVDTIQIINLGIESLEIREDLPDLRTLNLAGNRIRDLAFLNRTLNLKTLNLRDNELTALVLPVGPQRLSDIHLERNDINRIMAPSGMTILRVHGASRRLFEFYVPEPVIQRFPSEDPRGFGFTAFVGQGQYWLESSNDLMEWNRVENDSLFEEWARDFVIPVDFLRPQQFYRVVRMQGDPSGLSMGR